MKRKSENGSILFSMSIAMLIVMGSISFYYMSQSELRNKDYQKILTSFALQSYMKSVQAHLLSQVALIRSMKYAGNGDLWNCINSPEVLCNHPNPTAMTLVAEESDGTVLFLDATPGMGLSQEMTICNTYPSTTCPFRYEVNWSIQCINLTKNCYSPDIYVDGQLLIDLSSKFSNINPEPFRFTYRIK